MPTTPQPNKAPPQDSPAPPTRSDAGQPHPTTPPQPPGGELLLAAGQRPLPDYELVVRLGRGGCGEVWKARGPGGFDVALKFVLLREPAGDVELRALEVMKGIRHAHLLPLFGAWQREDMLIIAMELADRALYQRWKEARGEGLPGIPAPELLEYLHEAAKGLDYLNDQRHPSPTGELVGIQHRDVKPENLLLVGGMVKVGDCGLARLLEHTVAAVSDRMTPLYAAPEFFNGQATRWSDQYSLAVTYCQLRGGRLPFGENWLEAMGKLARMEAPDLSMLPEAERPVVTRALAREPKERWPTCRAFAEALAEAGRPAPSPAPPPAPDRREGEALLARRYREALDRTGGKATAEDQQGLAWLCGRYQIPGKRARAILGAVQARWHEGHPGHRQAPPKLAHPSLLDCTGPEGLTAAGVRQAQEVWARYLGREVEETVEIADGAKMTFVLVPPGKFRMGSPPDEKGRSGDETLHLVTLTHPFDLAKTEVTQAQYRALTGNNPSHFKGDDLPVETVSWEEARDYATNLTAKRGDKHLYRLPTEAEWEYCCRGGRPSSNPFGVGDGHTLASRDANFGGTSTRNVNSYPANAFVLYDMHGNVWEWCADWYGPYPQGDATDPTGPAKGSNRVIRGGCWYYSAKGCRAAFRCGSGPAFRGGYLGFRLARSLPSGGK
ncbi:MAG TPA: bifunctional serine/threonine-protein kinase/formylglycine-generating enzyme family protein, partial [Gemmataceae bacterium]|nr:bifunctional serine/threonine-protein kinase/formylglycine-generating enzyme family protein [Gemmataceae bacterium]